MGKRRTVDMDGMTGAPVLRLPATARALRDEAAGALLDPMYHATPGPNRAARRAARRIAARKARQQS